MDEIIQPIRQDRLNGMTYREIGEKYHIDPRTARRYAQNNLPLSQLDQRPFSSILDPYKPFIDQVLAEAPIPAATVYDWILEQGYPGKYRIVADYVSHVRDRLENKGPHSVPEDKRKSRSASVPAGHPDGHCADKSKNMSITEKAEKEFQHVTDLK